MPKYAKFRNTTSVGRLMELKHKNQTLINGWCHNNDTILPEIDGLAKIQENVNNFAFSSPFGFDNSMVTLNTYSTQIVSSPSMFVDGAGKGSTRYVNSFGLTYVFTGPTCSVFDKSLQLIGVSTYNNSSTSGLYRDVVVVGENDIGGVFVVYAISESSSTTNTISGMYYISPTASFTAVDPVVYYRARGAVVLYEDETRTVIGRYSPSNSTSSYHDGVGLLAVYNYPKSGTTGSALATTTVTNAKAHSMLSKPFIGNNGISYSFSMWCNYTTASIRCITLNTTTYAATVLTVATVDTNPYNMTWPTTPPSLNVNFAMINVKGRYLVSFPVKMHQNLNWNDPTIFVSHRWSWNPASPTNLTYVDSLDLSELMPSGFFPLNDDNTLIVIAGERETGVYQWSDDTGFVKVNTISDYGGVLGKDSNGRVWYQTVDGFAAVFGGDVSEKQIPFKTSLELADPIEVYYDQPIENEVILNSYDVSGGRIESTLILENSSGIIEFPNGKSTYTVTTSENSDTVIPITINGSGKADIDTIYSF